MKIKFNKETKLTLSFISIIIIILFAKFIMIKVDSGGVVIESLQDNQAEVVEVVEVLTIKVHIGGEVLNPGVYEVETDSRVDDIVKIAGGFTVEADENRVNLAKKIKDEEKIFIYNKNDKDTVEYVGVDIFNYGTKDKLLEIDGIGETYADRIISYREENLFNSFNDLLNIEGIGEVKLQNIIEFVNN